MFDFRWHWDRRVGMDQHGLERRVSISTYQTDISYCRPNVINVFLVPINVYYVCFCCCCCCCGVFFFLVFVCLFLLLFCFFLYMTLLMSSCNLYLFLLFSRFKSLHSQCSPTDYSLVWQATNFSHGSRNFVICRCFSYKIKWFSSKWSWFWNSTV